MNRKAIEVLDRLLALPDDELQKKFEAFLMESVCPECGTDMEENDKRFTCVVRQCGYIREKQ